MPVKHTQQELVIARLVNHPISLMHWYDFYHDD